MALQQCFKLLPYAAGVVILLMAIFALWVRTVPPRPIRLPGEAIPTMDAADQQARMAFEQRMKMETERAREAAAAGDAVEDSLPETANQDISQEQNLDEGRDISPPVTVDVPSDPEPQVEKTEEQISEEEAQEEEEQVHYEEEGATEEEENDGTEDEEAGEAPAEEFEDDADQQFTEQEDREESEEGEL